MFVARPSRILPLAIALLLLLAQGAGAGDAAAHQGTSPTEPAQPILKSSAIGSFLVIPYFEVDLANPGGTTLLYAIQSLFDPSRATVDYLDDHGRVVGSQTFDLAAWAVETVNLLDIPSLLPVADPVTHISRGSINIHGVDPGNPAIERLLAVDYFVLTDGRVSATGARALPYDEMVAGSLSPFSCQFWTVRFLNDPQYDEDTQVRLYVSHVSSQPTSKIWILLYDEDGIPLGQMVELPADLKSQQIPIQEILDKADSPSALYGTLLIFFGTDGGHVAATYEAFHRLAVSVEGACLVE